MNNLFETATRMAAILHGCRFPGGMAASSQDGSFGGNLFSRDTLRVLRDVMQFPEYRSFVREMLSTLPQWQGMEYNSETNEFPDALPHQVFRQIVGGRYLADEHVETAEKWTAQWGVPMTNSPQTGKQFVLYNSSDAVPLYLIALAEYCEATGRKDILSDRFYHHPTGEVRTVGDAALRCISYIVRVIENNRGQVDGLYAVPSTNPRQTSPSGVMRDGFDAYVRPDGTPIDYSLVAYVENQALAYEALWVALVSLFPDHPDAQQWMSLSGMLRRRTIDRMWLADQQFFASAIDSHGLVETRSSAAFEMLNGPFFNVVDNASGYVGALVRALYGEDFMTPVGVRMISLRHRELENDYYSYQGTGVVWGVTNGTVQSGLRKHNLHVLADDLGGKRLVGWFNRSGGAPELCYVHRDTNTPLYRPRMEQREFGPYGDRPVYASDPGQYQQAWSASAALRCCLEAKPDDRAYVQPWQGQLAQEVAGMAAQLPTAMDVESNRKLVIALTSGRAIRQRRMEAFGHAVQ